MYVPLQIPFICLHQFEQNFCQHWMICLEVNICLSVLLASCLSHYTNKCFLVISRECKAFGFRPARTCKMAYIFIRPIRLWPTIAIKRTINYLWIRHFSTCFWRKFLYYNFFCCHLRCGCTTTSALRPNSNLYFIIPHVDKILHSVCSFFNNFLLLLPRGHFSPSHCKSWRPQSLNSSAFV